MSIFVFCQFLFFLHKSILWIIFFFFSSIRRHTRYWRDWSSDVCSSDLCSVAPVPIEPIEPLLNSRSASPLTIDRKSTRLNSRHANISYAVFCLKKKKFHGDRPANKSRLRRRGDGLNECRNFCY